MVIFILKFSACLAILLLFYKVLLEHLAIHRFKRIYLLSSILISVIIPLITITEYVIANNNSNASIVEFTELTSDNSFSIWSYLSYFALIIYLTGVIIFSFRFFKNIHQIFNRIKSNPKLKQTYHTKVLLSNLITPHTFFSYIFLNKIKFENQQIPTEVLLHEETHAKQKHSIDVLFIEIVQIILWFNPLIYIIKQSIKLNHEYLADQNVLRQGISAKKYQQTILAYSSHASHPTLANAINYSLIKKRITVMKTQTSKLSARIRSLFLLPLLAILIFSFSSKKIVEVEQTKSNNTLTELQQEGISKKQLAEYNKLAKHYNDLLKTKSDVKILLEDVKRLKHLYNLMSDKQRKKAEPFPDFPKPPPPPPAPSTPKVKEVPPPAPPAPVKLIPKQKKKSLEAAKKHELILAKKAQEKNEIVTVREVKNAEKGKLRKLELEKVERLKEKEALLNQRQKELHEVRLKRLQEREVANEQRKLSNTQARLRLVEERQVMEQQRRAEREKVNLRRIEERERLREERAILSEKRKEMRRVSPSKYVEDMAEKGAVFFYKGKEITTKKALKLSKSKNNIDISTTHSGSKKPIVHISSNK